MPACPKCGAEVDDGTARCFYCGKQLREEATPEPTYVRPPEGETSPTSGGRPWIWLVIVGIVVVVVALLAFGGRKKAAPPIRPTRITAGERGQEEKGRVRREERLQRRQEARASGRSARTSSSPNQLRAILTDNTGSRTALVGGRRLKAGDDVEGRRIVEVSAEGVKVEYRQKTYTVRVGEKVY